MCNICNRDICPSPCPNADEASVVYNCAICGADLVVGDTYYHIFGDEICEDCIEESKGEVEFND